MQIYISFSIYLFLLFSCRSSIDKNEISTSSFKSNIDNNIVYKIDSSNCISKIVGFINWYKKSTVSLDKINIVMRDAEDSTYRINFKNAKQYLNFLSSSGYFSPIFIKTLDENFKLCDENFIKTKQNDGPPEGLDSDLVLNTQERDDFLEHLSQFTFKIENQTNTFSIVKMSLDYVYWIIKCDSQCCIISIEIGQDELPPSDSDGSIPAPGHYNNKK